MAIDWTAEVLGPVMAVFGEGLASVPESWPTYFPTGGSAFQLPGAVFDEQYQRVTELDDGSTATSKHPVLGVIASLFPSPPRKGDKVLIPSVPQMFMVVNPEPDGHGHILLILIEAKMS
ncbi:MAG: head-tail joining protein [Janthinobacterium lividum]